MCNNLLSLSKWVLEDGAISIGRLLVPRLGNNARGERFIGKIAN